MVQNRIQSSIVIITILLLAFFSVGAIDSPAAASSSTQNQLAAETPTNGGGDISARSDSQNWLATSEPWTEERMLAAQPYPMLKLEEESTLSYPPEEFAGIPGKEPSRPPEYSSISILSEEAIHLTSNWSLLAYDYPPPYTRYKNFDSYQVFPYSTIGVLFFTQEDVDYRCSAASIGKDAVWTAGHCIHSGTGTEEGWSEDIIFVPAYENGQAPFGVWTAYNAWTKGSWYSSADLRYDMGGAVFNTNTSGKTISQVVGNLGFSYNIDSSNELWFNFGYPSVAPFDGKWQYICTGPFAENDTSLNMPYPVGMGCDMTRGSSGGPWIQDFSGVAGTANFLNGNSSYRYTTEPEQMFSPYFGTAAKSLWNQLMGITERILLPMILK